MQPYLAMMFMSTLGLGTTLTFSSSHWLLAWMGLEINTLAILPLMAQYHQPRAVEATIKYFLAQATAAATILFASSMNAWMTGEWNITHSSNQTFTTLIMIALALKLGLAPMHLWMPSVLQGLNLTTGLIMSTWQKLAPFALVVQIAPFTHPTLLLALGLTSTMVGGWGGLNQVQLRKMLAYSSIAHLGWMIIILQLQPKLTILTLTIYIIMTSAAFLTFNHLMITKINTLATTWSKTPVLTVLTALTLLSLGGLPPLTGFMPKWLILQELTKQQLPLTATIIALSALLSLYFYLRLTYAMTLTISPNTNNSTTPWRLTNNQTKLPPALFLILTIMLLPMTTTMQALTL
uniref:NADH dehydrogenase subunit 2 n=1 Tax=Gastrodermus pygmaeus TaxID=927930 RepID=UPI002114BF2F|nr:NADH dehydrogenase subunit 2 [Corydoras pygmaeus]UTJ93393.1 NADH dehydrogenase subunit 2 [Corydoras pygmaeus]